MDGLKLMRENGKSLVQSIIIKNDGTSRSDLAQSIISTVPPEMI